MDFITTVADGSFGGYLAVPKETPAPGVVVAQEIFGVNQVMRDCCDWLAGEGFLAYCPDLFWRIEPGIDITDKTQEEWKRAFELFGLFDVDRGIEDMKAALAALRGHDKCSGRVGTIGYCLGGKLAYLMATRSDTDVSVGYYGVGLGALLDEAASIENPLVLHIATKDQFVPKEEQQQIREGLADNEHVTLHLYEGRDHAFARPGGEHYDAEAARIANERTIKTLTEGLCR